MSDLFSNVLVLFGHSPHTIGMMNSIESIRRRFTKKLRGLSFLTYDERCARLTDLNFVATLRFDNMF